ncbi:hypothetical protein FPZ43_03545 [Mucilaginibacter pallidiroseus]|uniref:Glycosyltransferase RgtA/B/C/D-like domain-containing protein n=1 Tax=Mucilaginibacter pallidiroseus TaxID=2599295 RepID=A0A563UJW3_9SPHI|nr:glycosyltransferase family 39 protein [Mucilaginibacter pallidiroseus]TWR31559.1 hypothetical protein FPZ43_03545 [Mucilaginibacter pallidiroseus]
MLLHFAANANYGVHADELYYIAMAEHLQWGYYDNGPFIVWMVKLSAMLFGSSTFAWRVLPTLISAATIVLTGQLTKRLGGNTFAIVVSCTAMLCSPAFTAMGYLLQPAAFDQFFWTAIAFCMVYYTTSKRPVYLYAFAISLSLGVLNKLSILLYACVWLFNVKINRQNIWSVILSGGIFIIVLSPYLFWQYQNGFPVLQYMRVVTNRHVYLGAGDYLFQLLFFHGAAMAVWLAGLAFILTDKGAFRSYRNVGIGFLVLVLAIFVMNGKLYYLLGAFPLLMAAGGICWEKMLGRAAVSKFILVGGLAVIAIIAMPVVLPILPYATMCRYVSLMKMYAKIDQPLRWDDGRVHDVPQYFADMRGWQELAKNIQSACKGSLTVYTKNYAAAGALSYYQTGACITVAADNSSFMEWAPNNLPDIFFYVTDEDDKKVLAYAAQVAFMGRVNDKLTAAHQLKVFHLKQPTLSFRESYQANRNLIQGSVKPYISVLPKSDHLNDIKAL